MDDLVAGADTTEDAIKMFRRSKEVFFKTNMNQRKWKSNSKQVNKYVKSHLKDNLNTEITYASLMLNPGGSSEEKVLRVPCCTDRDNIKKEATEKNSIHLWSNGYPVTYSYNFKDYVSNHV